MNHKRAGIWGHPQIPVNDGSPGRARTADLVINSHPLYQLSYQGIMEAREDNDPLYAGQHGFGGISSKGCVLRFGIAHIIITKRN